MDIILVIGKSCSGKTTFLSKINSMLNIPCISMGDLIRNKLLNIRKGVLHESLMGEKLFPKGFLNETINEYILGINENVMILDASLGIEELLENTEVKIILTIHLECDDDIRYKRFIDRMDKYERSDDKLSIYQKREVLFDKYFGNTLMNLKDFTEYFTVNNNENDTYNQFLIIDKILKTISSYKISNDIDTSMESCENILLSFKKDFINKNNTIKFEDSKIGNQNYLLLIKPGNNINEYILNEVSSYLNKYGFRIYGYHINDSLKFLKFETIKAHFGMQYLFALFPYINNSKFIPAYSLYNSIDISEYRKWWDRENKNNEKKELFWIIDYRDFSIVNAHIPELMNSYTVHNDKIIAIHITSNKYSHSINSLRKNFLGNSNPIFAKSGSLRYMAYRNLIKNFRGEINLQNNGFHMSDSDENGVLEIDLWFGKKYLKEVKL